MTKYYACITHKEGGQITVGEWSAEELEKTIAKCLRQNKWKKKDVSWQYHQTEC